ncbi:UNVERIFIED_CONTAM: hypothetical protein HDU68_008044 [Siphonaria sp. JEL0065]|nr:hypothetical protein HDU68_008044 [Siphonaria sp. JEL0065]
MSTRANPIYSNASNGQEQPQQEGVEEESIPSSNLNHILKDQIVPILSKMQNEKANERSWTAATVSSQVLDPSSRLQLLKGNITQILVDRINQEPDLSVRVDLSGCLSNLALFGGDDVALDFVRRGAVLAVLNQLRSVHEVVKAVKEEVAKTGGKLRSGIPSKAELAQFEDRKTSLSLLSNDASADVRVAKLLVAGITLGENEFLGAANKVSLAIACEIASLAAQVLSHKDLSAVCTEIVYASTQCIVETNGDKELTTAGDRDAGRTLLSAVQVVLEGLANAFSEEYVDSGVQEEEEEEWDGVEEMDEADEGGDEASAFDQMMEDEKLAAQMAAESSGAVGDSDLPASFSTSSNNDRAAFVERLGLIELILRVGGAGIGTGIGAIPAESPVYSFVELLNAVRVRAFGCFQNILTVENSATVVRIWGLLFEVANGAASSGSTNVLEIIEAAVSAIWALARGVDEYKGGAKISLFTHTIIYFLTFSEPNSRPNQQPIRNIFPSLRSTLSPSKDNLNTGILAKLQFPIATNSTIRPFLLSLIQNESSSIEAISESLNAIYDVYADAVFAYDKPVYVKGEFTKALKAVYPKLKARVKALDKRRFRDARERR